MPLPPPRPSARLPGSWRVWFVPFASLGVFVAAILASLWFVHRHESEIQITNLRRDTQYAELAISRKILAHQEFADRLAGALSAGQKPASVIEQAELYQSGRDAALDELAELRNRGPSLGHH